MTDKKFNFDAAMAELESITSWFESSEVDLDQGLVKFERGMELAAELKDHLATVENRVEKIKLKFNQPTARQSEAAPLPEPFPDDEPGNLFE